MKRKIPETFELIADTNVLHIWYNPIGCDYNGNFGPDLTSKSWVQILVHASHRFPRHRAVELLPHDEKKKIFKILNQNNCLHVDDLVEKTCLWGIPFTIAIEEFDEMEQFQ